MPALPHLTPAGVYPSRRGARSLPGSQPGLAAAVPRCRAAASGLGTGTALTRVLKRNETGGIIAPFGVGDHHGRAAGLSADASRRSMALPDAYDRPGRAILDVE